MIAAATEFQSGGSQGVSVGRALASDIPGAFIRNREKRAATGCEGVSLECVLCQGSFRCFYWISREGGVRMLEKCVYADN